MKNKRLFLAFEIFLIITVIVAINVFASQPGGTDDPIVSKSYVDSKIAELKALIQANNGAGGTGTAQVSDNEPVMTDEFSYFKYVPVHVEVGQTIIGGEGTEIIMRSGRAFTSISGEAGIVNSTTGKELFDAAEVEKNNVLIIPRDDGRGVRVVEDAWFIVRGEYIIK